jgi:hypothetical protein
MALRTELSHYDLQESEVTSPDTAQFFQLEELRIITIIILALLNPSMPLFAVHEESLIL